MTRTLYLTACMRWCLLYTDAFLQYDTFLYADFYGICKVLNKLLWQDSRTGIADFNHNGQLQVFIEIKRGHVLRDIAGSRSPEFYESSSNALCAIKPIYNYMCAREFKFGVLSTYEHNWFLRRSTGAPSTLLVSLTLPYDHTSPTLLKAYTCIASFPSRHPNIISLPVADNPTLPHPIDILLDQWLEKHKTHPPTIS